MRLVLICCLATLLAACSNDDSTSLPKEPPIPEVTVLPVADAGHPVTLQQGATVVLNASNSYDPEGKPITYRWTIVSKPNSSSSELSDTTSPFPSFYLDAVGDFVFELVVNNGDNDSLPVQVTISDSDGVPVANAGPDRHWNGSDPISLDGSASFDSDGDTLSYAWSISSAPTGSSATLARADTAFPVLTPDLSGDYVLELIVSDGVNSSETDQMIASDLNLKPVANAGSDQAYLVGTSVMLDATNSSDPDGDVLTFSWQIISAPASSASVIRSRKSARASFTPDVAGDYILGVLVNDGQVDSDLSTITLRESDHRPLANAGPDIRATVGQPVQLDGSNSTDIDGDQLTPSWSFTSKPKNSLVNLADVHTMHPTFTPDVDGDYVIKLTVYDGGHTSVADTVIVSTRNLPPVANAGRPLKLQIGQVAHLDGSNSSDPEGAALSYSWSIVHAPSSSVAALSSSSVVSPDFTPDVDGLYTFQLTVSDGDLTSAPSTVELSSNDQPPTANAGADQSVATGSQVSLDGSQSSDPEGSGLSYQWDFLSKPSGSVAKLSSTNTVLSSFTADILGDFVLQLTVTDINGQASRDTVVIRDFSKNTLPVASAGPDQQVEMGKNIVLDGSGSSDADGDTLSYSWALMSRPSGSSAQLNDANSASPNFTPDVEGDFVFQLVVSDGQSVSIPDVVMIHDTARNLPPSSNISVSYASGGAYPGSLVTLNANATDPNGDTLSYLWTLIPLSQSSSSLSSKTVETPTFTPDVVGQYVVTLEVSDGSLRDSEGTTITVVNPPVQAVLPVADAGQPVTLRRRDTVILNASKSYDPAGKPITYLWRVVSKPSSSVSSLSDPTSPFPSFYLDAVGDFVFELVVNNGDNDSLPVQVTISDSNGVPVANAGPDKRWNGTGPITLDGSGSFDSDGDALSYAWSISRSPAGSAVTLARGDTAFPVLTPDVSGDYVLELVVSDGVNSSAPDQVTVSDLNLKPVANAGSDRGYSIGSSVTLDATKSSDPDGDTLSFAWQLVSAPASSSATIRSSNLAKAQFTPDVSGDYILGVVVNDGQLDSGLSTVTLRQQGHRPVADAGSDITAVLGRSVQLDGSKSSDIDGDQLTPSWSFTSRPKNSGVNLADVHTMHPTFTPDVDGDYVIKLTVYDGGQTSLADTVTVSTRNLPPVANAGKALKLQVGRVAHLDGSMSSDPEGASLSYSWSIAHAPATSVAMLTSSTVVAPDFTPDVDGLYIFQLTVSDGDLTSTPSTVELSSNDQPPTANAGKDQSVVSGTQVSLDGTLSSDPEGSTLTYQWSFLSRPFGSIAQLASANSALPSFTADIAGDFVVQLTVTDAGGNSESDTVLVRDTSKNTLPIASAGPDLQVDLGKNLVLDGSGSSDADGDSLTYSWALMSGPVGSTAKLNDANTASPNFTPDVEGDFVFQLVVSDGKSVSIPDVVMVHDTKRNLAPSASFSFGYNSANPYTGQPITLNGTSSSDPNGDSLSYSWTLIPAMGSSAVLSGNGTATPQFTPDIAGKYVVALLVSDGSLSGSDSSFITVTDKPQGSPIALPSGHNLMFLSTEGGDSNSGGLFSVPESNLNNASELLSFHGVPGIGHSYISQGLAVHPTEKAIYTVIDGGGVFGYGAVLKYDPVTDEIETFASIPRQEIAGYVVREVRTSMIFHPDGKSAYFYADKGGTLDAGVLMYLNTDPSSADYRQISFIGEIGKAATNYVGSATSFSTALQWSGTNRLMGLFGNGIASTQRPALEFSPSDPSDLSKPWNATGIGTTIWSAARKFVYNIANDTILTVYSSRPPVLDSYGRDGLGGGFTLPSCRNPKFVFRWSTIDVYTLCEANSSNDIPVLYQSNTGGIQSTRVRQFTSLDKMNLAGITTSDVTSRAFLSVNDELASSFLGSSASSLAAAGLTVKPSQLVEITLPNYNTRTIISSSSRNFGSYFIGDPGVVDVPMDTINDRYVSMLSYNGGDLGAGALITHNRGDGSTTYKTLGFEFGGYPFGRVVEASSGGYYFSVAAFEGQSLAGTTMVYDAAAGRLTPVTTPVFFRTGLGLTENSTGQLIGLGVDVRKKIYALYSINPANGRYQLLKELASTQDRFPQYEAVVDQDNMWALTTDSLFCQSASSSVLGQHNFSALAEHEPVRHVTFNGAGGSGYVLTKESAVAGQGTIQMVTNNCALPQLTTVVSGLIDVPSTGLLLASDGFMYYGTENGKLMKFDTALNGVSEVATIAHSSVQGFLIEDSNGDIVGVANSTNGRADKMFAFTVSTRKLTTANIPSDRPLDPIYPGFLEVN